MRDEWELGLPLRGVVLFVDGGGWVCGMKEEREGMVGRRNPLRKTALVGDEMNWSCGGNEERENEIRCGR